MTRTIWVPGEPVPQPRQRHKTVMPSSEQIAAHLRRMQVTRKMGRAGKPTHWGTENIIRRAYWQELLIRWLEREGADFKKPEIVNLVRHATSFRYHETGGYCAVTDDQDFKDQLEAANL